MSSFTGKADAPILGVIAQELAQLLSQRQDLRALQANNAPRAAYGIDGQSAALATDPLRPGPVTNAAVQQITIAQGSGTGQTFALLILTFDAASGAGRFRTDGQNPTTAVGHEIPAGGYSLEITGMDNIRNFKMIAQGATTMPYFGSLSQ